MLFLMVLILILYLYKIYKSFINPIKSQIDQIGTSTQTWNNIDNFIPISGT
jgi:hypothetical protein